MVVMLCSLVEEHAVSIFMVDIQRTRKLMGYRGIVKRLGQGALA
jgi:hypothetical protein